MTRQNRSTNESELCLTLHKTLDATPEDAFDAWLDPAQVAAWFGPRNMVHTTEILTLEPRVGGQFRFRMHPIAVREGLPSTLVVTGTYLTIDRPDRLVFNWMWEHEGQESQVTITLEPKGDQTELTLVHEDFNNTERRDGHNRGWTIGLEQLADMLAKATRK